MRRRRRAPGGPACRLPTPWPSARCVRWGRLGGGWRRDSEASEARALGPGGWAAPPSPGTRVGPPRHMSRWRPPVGARPRRFVRRFREPGDLSSLLRARHALRENRAPGETGPGRGWRKTGWSGPGPRGLSKWKPRVRSKLRCAPRSRPGSPGSGSWKRSSLPRARAWTGARGWGGSGWEGGTWRCCPQPPPRRSPSRRPSASNTEL